MLLELQETIITLLIIVVEHSVKEVEVEDQHQVVFLLQQVV
jgi:hypothetical protein|tara:strand:+ start:423 stop:545 length:123 start_codon:yes stop_codon:yes gene_type:complete